MTRSILVSMCVCMFLFNFTGCSSKRLETTVASINFLELDLKLPVDAVIYREAINKTITRAKAVNLAKALESNDDFKDLLSKDQYPKIALAFLDAFHSNFRLFHPSEELTVKSVKTDKKGMKHVRFGQIHKDTPVLNSDVSVHLDASNRVYLVLGHYIPTPNMLDMKRLLNKDKALALAAHNLETTACKECTAEFVIAGLSLPEPKAAYRVLTKPSLTEGWEIIIDAQTGDILKKRSTVQK